MRAADHWLEAVTVTSVGSGTSSHLRCRGKTGVFWKKAGPGADIVQAAAAC